jgi:RNA polymerase sigma-70 factor (ECF subfamily)
MDRLAHDEDITMLLKRWSDGDGQAVRQLTPIVYAELHRIAQAYLGRQGQDHTWQPTELIGEAFVRLLKSKPTDWQTRTHFYATAAMCMRQILVDHARRKRSEKRGGGAMAVTLEEAADPSSGDAVDILAVDDALRELQAFDERKARIVELRYFGGMSQPEIAEAVGVHSNTVAKDLRLAEAWLRTRLERDR